MGIWNWSCALSGGEMWIIKAYFKVVGFVAWVVFKWMGGWVWPGFHTNFFGFIMEIMHTTETHKGWHLCTWEHVNTVVISNLNTRILLRFSKFLLALYEGGLNIRTIQPPITLFSPMLLCNKSRRDLGSKTLQSDLLWRQNFPQSISRSLSTVLIIFFHLFQQQRSYSNLLKFFDQFSVLMQL